MAGWFLGASASKVCPSWVICTSIVLQTKAVFVNDALKTRLKAQEPQ